MQHALAQVECFGQQFTQLDLFGRRDQQITDRQLQRVFFEATPSGLLIAYLIMR